MKSNYPSSFQKKKQTNNNNCIKKTTKTKALSEPQQDYIISPIDNAGGNAIIIREQFDAFILMQESSKSNTKHINYLKKY